jgi:hypothetical protein
MAHASKIMTCAGPDAPHAFDHIPLQARHGALDCLCPVCHGHGAWNIEIDLISHRSKRHACDRCHGSGWIETGGDPVVGHDIAMTPQGYPKWGTRQISGVPKRDD